MEFLAFLYLFVQVLEVVLFFAYKKTCSQQADASHKYQISQHNFHFINQSMQPKLEKNKICTIIISQDLIMFKQGFIFTVLTILALWWAGAFHVIDSGHIGVYKRGGAMLDSWTQPGLHFMIPFITKFHQVQVTLQTDQVRNIPCGTSSGVILNFDKIEVVNRLKKQLAHQTIKNYTVTYDQTWIFSKIHHEINQFCSSHTLQEVLIDKFNVLDESLKESLQKGCQTWAPGIEIIAVRVTKPTVPAAIAETFEDREVERTKLLIKRQEQRLIEKESQIEKKISKIKAETESKAAEITNKMNLLEKQANKKVSDIENKIVVIKETAYAKAKKYRQQKLIQLNERRLIPQKELQNMLTNIKNSQKTVYQSNLQQYLQSGIKLVQERSQRAAEQAGTSKKSKQ